MHYISSHIRVMIKAHHYIHSMCYAETSTRIDRLYLYRQMNTDKLLGKRVTLPLWNLDYTAMTDYRSASACFNAAGSALGAQGFDTCCISLQAAGEVNAMSRNSFRMSINKDRGW
jgi:hypothetical protein